MRRDQPHDSRSATFFLAKMLRALPTAGVMREGETVYPLAGLNLQADQDFTIALLDAWAVVADLISFYGARIADEGFVGSAIEPASILFMAQALGYRGWNGASSSAWLQLTVSSTSIPQDKRTPNAVLISPQNNVVVQSIPAQGTLPLIFESSNEAELRVEWNQLQPYQPTKTEIPGFTPKMTGVRLQGAVILLQSGDPILITTQAAQHLRFVEAVNVQRTMNYTAVTWQGGLDAGSVAAQAEPITGVFAFRQQAGLFARRALAWSAAPDTTRGRVGTRSGGVLALTNPLPQPCPALWSSIDCETLAEPVRVLLAGPDETLFAATAGGIFQSSGPDWKATWTALPLTPTRQDLHSLMLDDRGYLFAGGTRGAISFSTDYGQSWQSLTAKIASIGTQDATQTVVTPSMFSRFFATIKNIFFARKTQAAVVESSPVPVPAFDGVIRSIASGPYPTDRYVFAGTDLGVFFMQDGGSEWIPYNKGLKDYNGNTGLAGTVVYALALSSGLLHAGTGDGLYVCREGAWTLVTLPLSVQPAVYSLLLQSGVLIAGTSAGVFSSEGGGTASWTAANDTLPVNSAVRSLAVGGDGQTLFVLAGTDSGIYRAPVPFLAGCQWIAIDQQELALFTANASTAFLQDLKQNLIPPLIEQLFASNGSPLPKEAEVVMAGPGCWMITRPGDKTLPATPTNFAIVRHVEGNLEINLVIPISSRDIQTVAASSTGQCFAAAPIGNFLEQQWPGFQLGATAIPLDRVVSALRPGDFIGLVDSTPGSAPLTAKLTSSGQMPYQSFGRQATVTALTVEPDNRLGLLSPRNTTVLLKPSPLSLYTPDVPVFTTICGDFLDLEGTSHGLRDQQSLVISGLSPSAIIPAAGGVVQVVQAAGRPVPAPGLLSENVQALLSDGTSLWAAVVGVGVCFRPIRSSDPWTLVSDGLNNLDIRCLALTSIGLWAGTAGGVYLLEKEPVQPLRKLEWRQDDVASSPQDVVAFAVDVKGNLFAGTETEGVFCRPPFQPNWYQVATGEEVPDVRALVTDEIETLYIGTGTGIFQIGTSPGKPLGPCGQTHATYRSSTQWHQGQAGHNQLDVTALGYRGHKLYAGTSAGSVLSLDLATQVVPNYWSPLEPNTMQAAVRCFLFSENSVLAGTGGDGIFSYSDQRGWGRIFTSASNDISALLQDPVLGLLAACSNTTVLANATGYSMRTTPVLLFKAGGDCAPQLDLETLPPALGTLFQQHAVILKNPLVTILQAQTLWVIQNGSSRFIVRRHELTPPMTELDIMQVPNLALLSRRQTDAHEGNLLLWTFNDGIGTGTLLASSNEIWMAPSMPGSATRSEIITMIDAIPSPTGESTRCILSSPLQYLYDPSATTLSANLVYATQGITIGTEVLGSGDATVPNQAFRLKQPPLTYAYSAPPESKLTSSLKVIVGTSSGVPQPAPSVLTPPTLAPCTPSGELWMELPTLYGTTASAHGYSLSTDSQGNTTVNFGDGSNGSRLPTGIDNIKASYRTGIGPGGNVPSSSLIVFRKRPLGVTTVSNPVAATGGSNPEDVNSIRTRLSFPTRAIDRIVAISDYPNFCLAQANITKARVDHVPLDRPRILVLTLGAREGLPVDKPTITSLTGAITGKRASREPFFVTGFTPIFFRIKATIQFKEDGDSDVLTRVVDALTRAYSFVQRQFGQGVTASEITAAVQQVAGVTWVEIVSLHYSGSPSTYSPSLTARGGGWDEAQSKPIPAELLLLDLTGLYDSLSPPDTDGYLL